MLQVGLIPWTSEKSEQTLEAASAVLVDFVIGGGADDDAPSFSYLLSPKQFDTINKICQEQGWPQIHVPGVRIDARFVRHVLESRSGSNDRLQVHEIKAILAKAISYRCSIVRNAKESKGHHRQSLMFNAQHKVLIRGTRYYALVVLGIKTDASTSRNYLAPITCYHADEAKGRALKSR